MRAIWSGAISFGLVYIPVKLYSGTESDKLDFDLLRRSDHCRIRYVRVCGETGEEVPWEDIVKGYEFQEGRYVVLEDEDFERANVRKSKTIDIVSFAHVDEVDVKFLEKPYYLEPKEDARQAYALLRTALQRSGKVGIARFVLRTREHMAMLKPEGDAIVLNTMRFAGEIRDPNQLNLPSGVGVGERELDMALKLIDQLTEDWSPLQYHDTYTEDLKHIIEQKIEGREEELEEEEEVPVEVADLFSRLSKSLEMAGE
jgi:DNA end-binding protein Ku